MNYKIRGVKNLALRKEVKKALRFFAKELDIHDYDDVTIRLKAKKKMDALGYCSIKHYDDEDCISTILMEVDIKQDRDELINTLAHEMVHVKQYITGELSEDLDVWKGKKINSDDIDYDDQPWEIEADKVGDELDAKWNDRRCFNNS